MARTAPSLALGFAVLGLALQPTTAGAATSDEEYDVVRKLIQPFNNPNAKK